MKYINNLLKTILVFVLLIVWQNSFSQKDTVAVNYHSNGQISALIVYEDDCIVVTAYKSDGTNIYSRKCNITDNSADYTFTYFDNGAVESVKIILRKSDSDFKEVQYVEFDPKGGEVKSKIVSGVGVEIKDEGTSYNFEGGVIFKPKFK